MAATEPLYTISDLERESGLPRRTIHFYVQQGLLPPPIGAGPAARYMPQHLLRLRALRALQAAGWRLNAIRTLFAQASAEDLARWIHQPPPPPTDRSPTVPSPSPVFHAMSLADLRACATATAPTDLAPQSCLHYRLAPDAELVVRLPLSPDRRRRIEWLVAYARRLLATDEGGESPAEDPTP